MTPEERGSIRSTAETNLAYGQAGNGFNQSPLDVTEDAKEVLRLLDALDEAERCLQVRRQFAEKRGALLDRAEAVIEAARKRREHCLHCCQACRIEDLALKRYDEEAG